MKQIKGTINSIFNHEIPDNCNIYLNICRQLTGVTSYRGSKYSLVNSIKFPNLKSFPIPFLIDFDGNFCFSKFVIKLFKISYISYKDAEINSSTYYLEVVIEKDNKIICKNELSDQIGKKGRFRHYIDIYLDTKVFENY